MAEDIRNGDSTHSGVGAVRASLITTCRDEEEGCLYTSTTFYIWLRWLKGIRAILWGLGGIASLVAASHILEGGNEKRIEAAGAALAGVVLPALVRILHLDSSIHDYANAAAKFKNLQGEFKRLARIWSHKELPDFEREARKAFAAINEARKPSLTPPEVIFLLARWKIQKGHYTPDTTDTNPTPQ